MVRTGRIVGAVIAGAAVWALLWGLGNRVAQGALPEVLAPDAPLTHRGLLSAYIGYSVILSVLAGYVAAAVGGAHAKLAVRALAVLQVSLGLVAEISYWSLMPVWYHLVFLALIVPATVVGGRLRLEHVSVGAR